MQKFLKNESIVLTEINTLYEAKEYEKISAKRNIVFENLEFYKKTNVINKIVKSLFLSRYFEEIVIFVTELYKNKIEEYNLYFYCLASLIAIDDIYMSKSIIKKSNLLNSADVKGYIEEDGANYTLISFIKDKDKASCLLLLNYIKKYDDEGMDDPNLRILKYYEMIDSIYSLGCCEELVNYMNNIGQFIFE